MNEIMIVDNFLTKEMCEDLIKLYKNDNGVSMKGGVWAGRGRWPEYTEEQKIKLIDERKEISEKYFDKNFIIDNLHIMIWEPGHKMRPHNDYGADQEFPQRHFASMIYLNDDFEGGNLVIPELKFVNRPKLGQLVTFPGGKYLHGVTTITKGNRYTSACWFEIL